MQLEAGMIVSGKVSGITKFGAFIDLDKDKSGMVHISEIASEYVEDVSQHLTIGQEVKVKVLSIDENGKIALSIKKALPRPPRRAPAGTNSNKSGLTSYEWSPSNSSASSFEDMMSKFKQSSDEKMASLKKNDGLQRKQRRGNSKPIK